MDLARYRAAAETCNGNGTVGVVPVESAASGVCCGRRQGQCCVSASYPFELRCAPSPGPCVQLQRLHASLAMRTFKSRAPQLHIAASGFDERLNILHASFSHAVSGNNLRHSVRCSNNPVSAVHVSVSSVAPAHRSGRTSPSLQPRSLLTHYRSDDNLEGCTCPCERAFASHCGSDSDREPPSNPSKVRGSRHRQTAAHKRERRANKGCQSQ